MPTPNSQRMVLDEEAPEDFRAMVALDQAISLDRRLRELVRLRASVVNGCAYCVDLHSRAARKLGESERRVAAVAVWRESLFFDTRERAALALTDAITLIHEGGVPDEVCEAASASITSEELAELIFAITAINAWNRLAVATHLLPDPD